MNTVEAVWNAVDEVYTDTAQLGPLLLFKLNLKLADVVNATDTRDIQMLQIVQRVDAEGRLRDFVKAIADDQPDNVGLQERLVAIRNAIDTEEQLNKNSTILIRKPLPVPAVLLVTIAVAVAVAIQFMPQQKRLLITPKRIDFRASYCDRRTWFDSPVAITLDLSYRIPKQPSTVESEQLTLNYGGATYKYAAWLYVDHRPSSGSKNCRGETGTAGALKLPTDTNNAREVMFAAVDSAEKLTWRQFVMALEAEKLALIKVSIESRIDGRPHWKECHVDAKSLASQLKTRLIERKHNTRIFRLDAACEIKSTNSKVNPNEE